MSGFTVYDLLAFAWFFVCAVGYTLATRIGPLSNTGIVAFMNAQRRRWMQTMAERDNRIMDIQILDNLSRGNAFFASTAVLVLGGLLHPAALCIAAAWVVVVLYRREYRSRSLMLVTPEPKTKQGRRARR